MRASLMDLSHGFNHEIYSSGRLSCLRKHFQLGAAQTGSKRLEKGKGLPQIIKLDPQTLPFEYISH
jgi:hypothetical protein